MTGTEFYNYLVQDAGYDEATAKVLKTAFENEKVTTKLSGLKQQTEFDAIQARANQLEQSYARAKNYEDWYQKNHEAITGLEQRVLRYQERFGDLDAAPGASAGAGAGAGAGAAKTFTEEDIQKFVDARIQTQYGPQWSNLLKGSGRLIEKHLRAGRKTEIDWDKVAELAAARGGDLVAAYDEWDKPEREAAAKLETDKEVERRVKLELEKRLVDQTRRNFPGGADATPSDSPLAKRSTTDEKAHHQKVVEAAITGEYEGFAAANYGNKAGKEFFQ
jgi:hypothetical protein